MSETVVSRDSAASWSTRVGPEGQGRRRSTFGEMDLRLIRNATLRLRFAGVEFLIDPMLGVKGSIRAMGDSTERNPTVDLPCPIAEVLDGVDVVLVSHMHPDHFDEAAFSVVPRDIPIFCQPGDIDR